MTIKEAQHLVDEWIKTYGVRYFNELTNTTILMEEMGELDNTLIIYLTADNGATAEGTPTGTVSELLMQNGFPPLTMEKLKFHAFLDLIN